MQICNCNSDLINKKNREREKKTQSADLVDGCRYIQIKITKDSRHKTTYIIILLIRHEQTYVHIVLIFFSSICLLSPFNECGKWSEIHFNRFVLPISNWNIWETIKLLRTLNGNGMGMTTVADVTDAYGTQKYRISNSYVETYLNWYNVVISASYFVFFCYRNRNVKSYNFLLHLCCCCYVMLLKDICEVFFYIFKITK